MAKLCEAETPLCSPSLDADGQLFVCSNLEGKVYHVAEGEGASQLAVSIHQYWIIRNLVGLRHQDRFRVSSFELVSHSSPFILQMVTDIPDSKIRFSPGMTLAFLGGLPMKPVRNPSV